MDVDDEAKKVIWSLQENKRNEKERNVFKPSGKKPKNRNFIYFICAIAIVFLISFALSLFSKTPVNFCFFIENFCFNSSESKVFYVLFIAMNCWILILGIGFAYWLGSKIGSKFKI